MLFKALTEVLFFELLNKRAELLSKQAICFKGRFF